MHSKFHKAALAALMMPLSLGHMHAAAEQSGLSASLPEWKTPEQLATWRAEITVKTQAKEAAAGMNLSTSTPQSFYTGKPYLSESDIYSFKYRQYNPGMARWTTVDPSGFPDGANNRLYSKNNVLTYLDPDGKNALLVAGVVVISVALYNYTKDISSAMQNANLNNQFLKLAQQAQDNGNANLAETLRKDALQPLAANLSDCAGAALNSPGTTFSGPAGIPGSSVEAVLSNGNYLLDVWIEE